jgi:hypothetical protein
MHPCVLVDIDGTIADLSHRLHHIKPPGHVGWVDLDAKSRFKKNWKAFHAEALNDSPIHEIIHLVHVLFESRYAGQEVQIIFVTARHESQRADTERWLDDQGVPRHSLYMRADADYRSDDIVKGELLDQIIESGYAPMLAIEDRKRVVDMYRARGIKVLHVAEGEF